MSDSSSANRSLLLGAVTNWLAFAATLAVGFFLAPYLVRSLGDARYGVWCVVESILAYFTLFDLGIAACLVRFVAKFHATGDRGDLNRVVSASLFLFLLAACGAAVLLLQLVVYGVAVRVVRGPKPTVRIPSPLTWI